MQSFCHQARLAELETPRRVEHLNKLEDLKRQLQELEKQVRYEKFRDRCFFLAAHGTEP